MANSATNSTLTLATENFDLSYELFRQQKYNWATILLYYSALMFAKTCFTKNSWRHPGTHDAWMREIENHIDLDTRMNYQLLYGASRKNRYNPTISLKTNKQNYLEYLQFFNDYKSAIRPLL